MSRKIIITRPKVDEYTIYRMDIDLGSYTGPVYAGFWDDDGRNMWVDICLQGDQSSLSPLSCYNYRDVGNFRSTIDLYVAPQDNMPEGITNPHGIDSCPSSVIPQITGATKVETNHRAQSLTEFRQRAISYFGSYTPGQGIGTVTLQTKAPSQLLTFTSQRLGQSFKYWVRGNMTLELWKPTPQPSGDTLWIFRNGAFTDAVINGFNISQYVEANDWGAAQVQYKGTSIGILSRQQYSLLYTIENGYIVHQRADTIAYVAASYSIPIKRVSGYNKIVATLRMLEVDSGYEYNEVQVRATTVENGASTLSGGEGCYLNSRYDPTNDVEVTSDFLSIDNIDYIFLNACQGKAAIKDIRLIKVPVPDWELLVQAKYNPTGTMIVDSDLNGRYYYVDEENMTTTGRLMYEDLPMQSYFKTVYAKTSIVAIEANIDQSTSRSGSFAKDAAISTYTDYTRAIIAKKNSNVTLPLEIAFYWTSNQGMEGGVLKQNGTFDGWHSPTSGDVFYVNSNGIDNWYRFDGKIKAYVASYGTDNSGSWYEYDAQNINSIRGGFIIAIAIPN